MAFAVLHRPTPTPFPLNQPIHKVFQWRHIQHLASVLAPFLVSTSKLWRSDIESLSESNTLTLGCCMMVCSVAKPSSQRGDIYLVAWSALLWLHDRQGKSCCPAAVHRILGGQEWERGGGGVILNTDCC